MISTTSSRASSATLNSFCWNCRRTANSGDRFKPFTIPASAPAAIVQDLLTVARGIASPKATKNLNCLIEEYLKSPEHAALRNHHPLVSYKTDCDPGLPNIDCSSVHIKKTLMNLISNAVEAIDTSGTVAISTENRYLDHPLKGYDNIQAGEYAVLKVSDSGSGIPHKDLDRIFEPFYTKKVMGRSGTGLGLAVVWNTVQDHNGYINVQSDSGGTPVRTFFPRIRKSNDP